MAATSPATNKNRRVLIYVAVGFLTALAFAIATTRWVEPAPYRYVDRTLSDLDMIRSVLEDYRRTTGYYPSTAQGLNELLAAGYVRSAGFSTDSWGSTFEYEAEGNIIRLYSSGPNRLDEEGGGDDILSTPLGSENADG